MIVHAEILVVLLLSGILGPVVAQGQPERKPVEASPGGGPAMVSPEPNPDAQAIGDLLGRFNKAYNARDAKALGELFTPDAEIEDDDKVTAKGKPRQLAGKWSLTNNLLTLAQEGDAGALVGRVSWPADDKWSFRVIGTGSEDQGLLFTHRKRPHPDLSGAPAGLDQEGPPRDSQHPRC